MTLKMTTAQVVETSVTVTNSSFQNYTHPDDHTTRTTNFLLCALAKYSPHKTAARLPSREVSNKYSPLMAAVSFPLILSCGTVQQSPAYMNNKDYLAPALSLETSCYKSLHKPWRHSLVWPCLQVNLQNDYNQALGFHSHDYFRYCVITVPKKIWNWNLFPIYIWFASQNQKNSPDKFENATFLSSLAFRPHYKKSVFEQRKWNFLKTLSRVDKF